MGFEVAFFLVTTALGAFSSERQRRSASKAASKQKKSAAALAEQNRDKSVTGKGIAKKGARAALVAGSSEGVLSIEDKKATSGRGTLLGN